MKNSLIEQLESMPFEIARSKILKGEMNNQIGSVNHEICLSWLSLKDAEIKECRDKRTLYWARNAAYAAYTATILSLISIIVAFF
jgi:hypothetical protein